MKHTLFSFFFALGCGALFCACASKTTEVIYNNGVPGTIIATVVLYDSLLTQNAHYNVLDPSGVEVSVEGTSLKALTDKNGKCAITNVPPGVYNFLFKKDGFATQVYGQKEFAGNGTDVVDNSLWRFNNKTAELVLRPFDSAQAIYSWKVLDSLKRYEYVEIFGNLFFSDKPGINPYDTSSYRYVVRAPYSQGGTGVDIPISKASLLSVGFTHNETLYCLLVISNVDGFNDPVSGKMIFYNGLSPYNSGEKSFVLP